MRFAGRILLVWSDGNPQGHTAATDRDVRGRRLCSSDLLAFKGHFIDCDLPGEDFERQIDMPRMRRYRQARARVEMERRDLGACLLYNINVNARILLDLGALYQ